MADRWKRREILVSDVMPATLRTANRGPLVARLKEYRYHYATNPAYIYHTASRVGRYTIRVHMIEDAANNRLTRAAWDLIEAWAENRNVTIL